MTLPIKSELASEKVQSAIQTLTNLASQNQTGAIFTCSNVLNGGELSPHLHARYDLPRYQTGCKKLLNMIPLAQGGITKRPGLEYLGDTTANSRFLPFTASATDCQMLEIDGQNFSIRSWSTDLTPHAPQPLGITCPCSPNFLSTAQSADVIFCAHRLADPFKIMRFPDHWEIQKLKFTFDLVLNSNLFTLWPQYHAIKNNKGIDQFPNKTDTITYYAITAVDENTGIESKPFYFTTNPGYDLSSSVWVEMYFGPLPTGVSQYRIYKKSLGIYGFIGTTQGNETFYDKGIKADTQDTLPDAWNMLTNIKPSIVFLYQQRLGFASGHQKPMTIWLSQAGIFESFQTRKPPKDDEAIEVTLAATQANSINWIMTDRNNLAIGTEGGEYTLSGGSESTGLTPSNLAFQDQSSFGSQSYLNAIRAGADLIYIQRGGHVPRTFGYSFQSDKYQSQDISLLSRHILRDSFVHSWAWQQNPYSILWMVLSDGSCASLTYMPEHEVVAWARHETTGGIFQYVACIPGKDGNDQVWFHIKRGDKYTVERLRPFSEKPDEASYNHTDGQEHRAFQARCIPTMPEMNMQNGSTMMHFRKINAVKCRVMNAKPFQARIGTSQPMPVPVRGAGFVTATDWACPIAGTWREGDDLELIFDGPDPVTLLAVTSTVELADLGGSPR